MVLTALLLSCAVNVDIDDKKTPSTQTHYLVVFGDIQQYVAGGIDFYKKSVHWIENQIFSDTDICAVIEVGDVTNNNEPNEWLLFKETTYDLANLIPYYVCTGNHDYDWEHTKIKDRKTSLINLYAHFAKTDNTIVDYYQGESLENYIARIQLGGFTLLLLVLEFGPREEVVNWALSYVQDHRKERFLLLTHEWLNASGERLNAGTHAELHFNGYTSYSTPEEIWQKLVKNNDNIIGVLCGHEKGFSHCLFSKNSFGREVPQIMFNLQFMPNGGNGIIQIWKFSDYSNEVNICAYDTINEKWFLPDSTSYGFTF